MSLLESAGQSHLRRMWRLSWPAIIEQILAIMVSYADTAMVGVLGAAGTAAVSVNAAAIWLLNGFLMSVGVGYSVQVSHAIGAGDDERVRQVVRQGVLAAAVVGLLALAVYQLLAGSLPRWLGAEPDVLPQASLYLRLYTLAAPFVAAGSIFSAILRCMGNTKTPLYFNTTANVINVILNFFLIYPTRPASVLGRTVTIPGAGLGAAGAATASAIALTFAGVAMLAAGVRQGRFRIALRECRRPDGPIIRQAVYLGVPTAIERATINLGQIAMTALVASLGTVSLAAHRIATTAEGVCYLPAYGISYAAVALVGQSVGARSRTEAGAYGRLAGWLGFWMCLATGAALFVFAPQLAALFNTDPLVVVEATVMLRIVAFAEPLFAVSIILFGALRGARDVRFPMVVGLAGMWGLRVPLAFALVYWAKLGLTGVWIAMTIELNLRGLLSALRWKSGAWELKCGLRGSATAAPPPAGPDELQ